MRRSKNRPSRKTGEVSRGWWNKFTGDLLSAHARFKYLTHAPSRTSERKVEGGGEGGRERASARDQGERPNSSVNIVSSVDRRLHVNEPKNHRRIREDDEEKSRTNEEYRRVSLWLAYADREKSSFSRKFVSREFMRQQRPRNVLIAIGIRNVSTLPPFLFIALCEAHIFHPRNKEFSIFFSNGRNSSFLHSRVIKTKGLNYKLCRSLSKGLNYKLCTRGCPLAYIMHGIVIVIDANWWLIVIILAIWI